MKVEMRRSRMYMGRTLEAGRVVEVDDKFGLWLTSKGMAVPYHGAEPVAEPSMLDTVSNLIETQVKKRGRPAKGNT